MSDKYAKFRDAYLSRINDLNCIIARVIRWKVYAIISRCSEHNKFSVK